MSLIITDTDQARVVTENAIADLKAEEQRHSATIDSLTQDQLLAEAAHADLKGNDRKENKAKIDKLKAAIKLTKQELEVTKNKRLAADRDLAKYATQTTQAFVKQNTNDSVLKTFIDNNIHYVISGQSWWRVEQDVNGNIRIKDHDFSELKDLIFYASDWEIKDEMEVKRFAKSNNKFFKDIVRDFTTKGISGVYNQMDDIRKYWLQPIPTEQPHPAFQLLTLSIGGGDLEYSDQLERLVAYRYVHPDDVMIPNVDSCATGGTGRDTLFNMLRIIFTDECCGDVSEETFKGTHNGDLFGKMWVKVDEQNSATIPIDKIKALTGAKKYRHRAMNTDARDAQRLFTFWFFRNGYTTTAKLAGSGSSGEDRRFEPIIARVNLARYVAYHLGLIDNLDIMLTAEQEAQAVSEIKRWQREVYTDREEIAKWLYHIIMKHNVVTMTELGPLHGKFYQEMKQRQRKGIEIFMPKFMDLFNRGESTVISVKDAWQLYQVAETAKVSKDWFKNQMMYWLNTNLGWDSIEEQDSIYPYENASTHTRRIFFAVHNRIDPIDKKVFNIEDFVDPNNLDEKGNPVGDKINQYSIRDGLK